MMKKITAIGLVLVLAMSLGACGGKEKTPEKATETKTSSGGAVSAGSETTSVSEAGTGETNTAGATGGSAAQTAGGNAAQAAGGNTAGVAEANTAGAAGANATGTAVTDPAGGNVTYAAGTNGTAAAGENGTSAAAPVKPPVIMNPSSMKMAYQPETEDQKYAREITGLFLLTDLKDTKSEETGAKAMEMAAEGRPMYMEFFGNGTMQENAFGDPMGGLWDREYLTLGSDRIPYEFSGDHVTVTTDNMELTFTRTTKEELDLLLTSGKTGDGQAAEESGDSQAAEDAAGDETDAAAEATDEAAAGNATDETGTAVDNAASDGTGTTAETAAAAGTYDGEVEQVLIEDELCRMTATGYDFSDPRGFVIHVVCENYSIYNYAFSITQAVVNNIMFEPGSTEEPRYWSMDVEPMSSKEGEIIFSADRAAEYGITAYDYIQLYLWVRNLDQWMEAPVYQDDEELYPTGKVTGEGLQTLPRRTASGETKIAEESKFTFTILGSEFTEEGDFVLKTCIENLTWQNLMFSWDDVYVNGDLLDPFWAAEVLPNTIRYDDIVFSADDLREHGVTSVSDVSFTMTAYDSKDWLSYSFYTETSKYRP